MDITQKNKFGLTTRHFQEHGFYDACIVGGGDTSISSAAYGNFERVILLHRMNELQKQRYLIWARPYFEAVRENVSFVDCDIFHLWHGDLDHRKYRERHEGLAPFEFDHFRTSQLTRTVAGAGIRTSENSTST